MKLLPLELGINVEGAIHYKSRRASKAFLPIQKKVLSRDDHVCRYCGLRAEKFQEVVNIDGNYRNNDLHNLATACVFCAQCQLVGLKNNSKIIYLPDISQLDLNHFVRVIFCSTHFGEDYAETAKTLAQMLKQRANAVENVFGTGASDAPVFAQTYADAAGRNKKGLVKKEILTQLRWLPNRSDYEKVVQYWAEWVITRDTLITSMGSIANSISQE